MILLYWACAGNGDLDTATAALCEDAPRLEWENFGSGFVTENCQPCHASTSADRYGAPSDVTFDTEDETLAWSTEILARATGESPSMPPAGGVDDVDREKLAIWLSCWE